MVPNQFSDISIKTHFFFAYFRDFGTFFLLVNMAPNQFFHISERATFFLLILGILRNQTFGILGIQEIDFRTSDFWENGFGIVVPDI